MHEKQTSAEQAYHTVKELIITGELPGGDLISEGEIAARTGTSRTPVREAFLRLQSEGWMRLYPKRGALVVAIAEGEMSNVLSARLILETGALASYAVDPAARVRAAATMHASLARQRTLADRLDQVGFSAEDADFHATVVRHADNPLLDDFYASVRDRQRRMTASSVARDPGRLAAIIDDHQQLAEAVERGDVTAYEHLLRDHMRRVHDVKEIW